jgi:hypothetical protein
MLRTLPLSAAMIVGTPFHRSSGIGSAQSASSSAACCPSPPGLVLGSTVTTATDYSRLGVDMVLPVAAVGRSSAPATESIMGSLPGRAGVACHVPPRRRGRGRADRSSCSRARHDRSRALVMCVVHCAGHCAPRPGVSRKYRAARERHRADHPLSPARLRWRTSDNHSLPDQPDLSSSRCPRQGWWPGTPSQDHVLGRAHRVQCQVLSWWGRVVILAWPPSPGAAPTGRPRPGWPPIGVA